MNKTLEGLEKAIQHLANYQNPSITRSDQKESLAKCWWALHELRDSLEFLNDKNNSETIEKPDEKRYYLKIEVLAKNSQSMNEGLKVALSEIPKPINLGLFRFILFTLSKYSLLKSSTFLPAPVVDAEETM